MNNKTNSIDVDKFDYLQRDCKNVNYSYEVNFQNLVKSARVVNNGIAYDQSEFQSIVNLFLLRHEMFSNCYYFDKV